jgi:hypothetical protein
VVPLLCGECYPLVQLLQLRYNRSCLTAVIYVATPHSQSTHPSWHLVMTQPPFVQVVSATCLLGSAVHVNPQPPQLVMSVFRLISQPSLRTPLQSLYLKGKHEKYRNGGLLKA